MSAAVSRRGVLASTVASIATTLLMGGIVYTAAEPEELTAAADDSLLPGYIAKTDREVEFLEVFRSLPTAQMRQAFVRNFLRYGDGELTMEEAANAFYTEGGLEPAEARAKLDAVMAESGSDVWKKHVFE